MPMKSKRMIRKKKRIPARKRAWVGGPGGPRVSLGLCIPNTVKADFHCMQRELTEIVFSNDSVAETKISKLFGLSAIQNYTDYTAIWDQYRINMVKVEFVPILTEIVNRPFDDTTSGTAVIPNYCVSVDRDDNASETYDELRARQYSYIRKATEPLTLKFKPNRLTATYNTIATTGYTVDNTKKFIDCAYPLIPHYGLKICLEAASPANAYRIIVRTTYFMSYAHRRK